MLAFLRGLICGAPAPPLHPLGELLHASVLEPPLNIDAIRVWLTSRRPDMVAEFEILVARDQAGEEQGRLPLMLLLLGFEVGRAFQHANPTLALENPQVYTKESQKSAV